MQPTTWTRVALAALAVAACDTKSPTEPGNLVPRTVAEDPSLPAIELNGARFHAQTFGNPANPVIIFLHGGPGGDYRGMLPLGDAFGGHSLADDHFLVFWDQRGSGLSQRVGKEQLTNEVYLADLNALVNRYSPNRPVYLIGISWGGMFATDYINRYPQRVAGAVLIEPGPLDGVTAQRINKEIYNLDIGSEWLNDFAWSSGFLTADDHARMDYERALGLRDAQPRFGESRTNREPVWRLGAAANRYIQEDGQTNGVSTYDFTDHLSAFRKPVLFIAGALSQVLGESLQSKQVLKYPDASLVVIDGAGHDVAWVKTAAVLTHVRAYLNAREGAY